MRFETHSGPCARVFGLGAVVAAFLMLAALPAAAQTGFSKVSGTIVDADGNPVGDLKLVLTPEAGSVNAPRTLKVNKSGQFSHSFIPYDTYTVALDGSDMFLKTMEFVLRDPSNLEIQRGVGDAHPTEGLPKIRIPAGHRVELNFVVADKAVQQQMVEAIEFEEQTKKLSRLREFYEADDMEGVLEEADSLLEKEPDLGGAMYLKGVALLRLEKPDEAFQTLKGAVELAPDQAGIWSVLGKAALETGERLHRSGDEAAASARFREAADYFAKDLERSPGSLPSLVNRAAALDRAGDREALRGALEQVVAADPENLQAYLRLATLCTQQGDLDTAMKVLDRMPVGGKDSASATYNIAVKFYNDDDKDAALIAARKAAELDPELADPHRLLARIHLSRGEEEEAIEALRRFLELAPDDPRAAEEREILEHLEKSGA